MKIKVNKTSTLIYDGTHISNGHWSVNAVSALSAGLVFTEPYQFLLQNKMPFKKDPEGRPVLQSALPNLGELMTIGDCEATITDVQVGGLSIVNWRRENEEQGVAQFLPQYLDMFEYIADETGGVYTWTGSILSLSTDDGEIIGMLAPVKNSPSDLSIRLKSAWEPLQIELISIGKEED